MIVTFRWIPVEERLPKQSGKYLVTVQNGNVYAGTFDAYSGRFGCKATAWAPLPPAYDPNKGKCDIVLFRGCFNCKRHESCPDAFTPEAEECNHYSNTDQHTQSVEEEGER